MKLIITTIKYIRWLSLLAACIFFGCASLPEKQKGIWPWEYGQGKGEPNTGDFVAFRAGVMKFGEPPKAVKPLPPEPAAADAPGLPVAATISTTKAEPPSETPQRADITTDKSKKAYNFKVSEKKSNAESKLLLNSTSRNHDITAFNDGNAPVSVVIGIDQQQSENTLTDKTLPYYAVVPANTDQILVHLSPKLKDAAFNFRYSYKWSIGDFTARHNCPEQYRFPFGEKVQALASVSDATNSTPFTRYAVLFSVPKGTPVLAARKGNVIQISADDKIDVLHDDSTIGTYSHLENIAEDIFVGKTVTTDDILGKAGTAEDNKDAYVQLTVWRPERESSDALRVSSKQIDLVAVSFPMAFISSYDKGAVLTQSQQVSRGKLQTPGKKTKRK